MTPGPVLDVIFYQSTNGREPVRDWLRSLSKEVRHEIGADIQAVQFRWPLGMPKVRKFDADLWEVRSRLPDGIARILFTVDDGLMVLLHGIIKKSQKTPAIELEAAMKRLRLYLEKNL